MRSKSNISKKSNPDSDVKSLKLLSGQTIQLPTRERFNEDVEEVVEEIKSQDKQSVVGSLKSQALSNLQAAASEHGSQRSKRTMTQSELKNFFSKGQEEIKSKYSCAESIRSKVSSYKQKLLRKLEEA